MERFLNDNDYLSIITKESLSQLTRNNSERLCQAEESAEASIVEYLVEGYRINDVLNVGKQIKDYNYQMTYPPGSHFYYNGTICESTRTITGRVRPSLTDYWKEYTGSVEKIEYSEYSQFVSYAPGVYVSFGNLIYECTDFNGPDFDDIRIPGIIGWTEIDTTQWAANTEYKLFDVVEYSGNFYALIKTDGIDTTVNPYDSYNWGLIGDYDKSLNIYEFSNTEYVVYKNKVFYPIIDVNSDTLEDKFNYIERDPRNSNIKKHMVMMSLYELHKLVSPNNVSSVRITDYETSITWLRDAARMRINPGIPRKMGEDDKPIADFAIATFQRDYDPNKNPWQL